MPFLCIYAYSRCGKVPKTKEECCDLEDSFGWTNDTACSSSIKPRRTYQMSNMTCNSSNYLSVIRYFVWLFVACILLLTLLIQGTTSTKFDRELKKDIQKKYSDHISGEFVTLRITFQSKKKVFINILSVVLMYFFNK